MKAREGSWQQVTADIAAAEAASALLREPARRRVLAEAAQVSLFCVTVCLSHTFEYQLADSRACSDAELFLFAIIVAHLILLGI